MEKEQKTAREGYQMTYYAFLYRREKSSYTYQECEIDEEETSKYPKSAYKAFKLKEGTNPFSFSGPLFNGQKPGNVYEIEEQIGGTHIYYKKKGGIEGFVKDNTLISQWNLMNSVGSATQAKMTENEKSLLKLLEPIKDMYWNADRNKKNLIMAEVIRIVTGWGN